MKTIIVPTDFSDASVNAAFYAAAMARHIHAGILLLHVLPAPLTIYEVPLPPGSLDVSMEEAGKSLEALRGQLKHNTDGEVDITCHVTSNSFLEEVEHFNRQKELFAVIMGTSGAGATGAFFLGSFSLTAARHLMCPLIVVPPGYRYKVIENAGLACDMRNVLDTVPIKGIRALMDHYEARLEVLYVRKPGEEMVPEVLRESKFMQICLVYYHPDMRIIAHEDIQEGLADFVHQSKIDLLLVLPKERNFPENIFHKSITKKMVLHPPVPVMIVHH